MNNKKDKENFFKRFTDLILFLSLGLLFFVLGIIGLLNKQDYKLYDLLLKLKKSPTESEQILLVDIDNISISEIGEWPWSRDIIADALFRMKEFGAKSVTFDIEYLSPSPLGVPRTSENAITDSFNYIQDEIESIVYELSDSVEKGYILPNTINEQTNIMFNDYINPSIDNFKNNLVTSLLYQDNDEYFGKALKFFDNSWVTVNTRDLNIVYTHDDIAFVENNYLLNNVSDTENHIRKNNIYTVNEQYGGIPEGFSPTLHTLVKRAKGCGFTNVQIDTDGSRRRIELLFYRNGKYLPQLVFAPLLNMLDVQSIQRTKHKLILNGCLFPKSETRETVSIPLDNHGRMFINWIKPDYDNSFRHVSLSDTFKLDCIENEHIIYFENLLNYEILNENGTPLDYLVKIKNFNDEYNAIIQEKNSLLKLCEADSKFNISDEQYSSYFNRRNQYFNNLKEFLDTDIISSVTQRLDELGDLITENDRLDFVQVVSEQIDLLKDAINTYTSILMN
jgi:CHASE2 domain-containing sensor protein